MLAHLLSAAGLAALAACMGAGTGAGPGGAPGPRTAHACSLRVAETPGGIVVSGEIADPAISDWSLTIRAHDGAVTLAQSGPARPGDPAGEARLPGRATDYAIALTAMRGGDRLTCPRRAD
jgi:hypothetical protein